MSLESIRDGIQVEVRDQYMTFHTQTTPLIETVIYDDTTGAAMDLTAFVAAAGVVYLSAVNAEEYKSNPAAARVWQLIGVVTVAADGEVEFQLTTTETADALAGILWLEISLRTAVDQSTVSAKFGVSSDRYWDFAPMQLIRTVA